MPSDTLDLLDEIVKGAEASSGKGAGEPLRAADWNTLADAIVRLARLAASREKNEADTLAKTYARADHEHQGQVGLTWLDPPTRALVEGRGGAADIVARLNDLARETTALRADLATLTGQVDRLRDGVRDANDAQHVRDRATEALGSRLDGVIGVDRRVTALDGRLTGIGDQVQEALDFRNTLVDDAGAPLDVRGIAGRMTALEASQDRLRLADGEIVRIRDFESRIAGLEDRTIDRGVLDERIGQRLGVLIDDPANPLTSRAGAAAAATLDPRLAVLEAGAQTTRNDIGALQGQRAADAAQIVTLDTRLNQQTARTDALTSSVTGLGTLTGRVSALETGVANANTRINTLDALRGNVATMQTQLTALSGLPADAAALRRDLDAQGTRLGNVESSASRIGALDTRLSAVEGAGESIAALDTRLSTAEAGLGALGGRVTVNDSRIGALSNVPGRLSVLERDGADVAAWRSGVDIRLANVPDRNAFTDINTRLTNVETTTAAQQTRLTQLSGLVDRPAINPILVRPIVG
jgi:hypothetical protein